MEAKLQSKIIIWLKSKGAYVIKNRSGPGVPTGCPDIIFVYEGAWGVIEVKAYANSSYRTGQKPTLAFLSNWSPFVYVAHSENWPEVKAHLEKHFF